MWSSACRECNELEVASQGQKLAQLQANGFAPFRRKLSTSTQASTMLAKCNACLTQCKTNYRTEEQKQIGTPGERLTNFDTCAVHAAPMTSRLEAYKDTLVKEESVKKIQPPTLSSTQKLDALKQRNAAQLALVREQQLMRKQQQQLQLLRTQQAVMNMRFPRF
jgi:ATP/maltotriose-dependent transcriptional regulator MalT